MKVWLEKTLIRGAPLREIPGFGLGQALISPCRSDSGADVYFQMREVEPGDKVLHLVDNNSIVGRSLIQDVCSEIQIGREQWYRVPLSNYESIEPALDRKWSFSETYRESLLSLIDSGYRNLFYTRRLSLMQGRYLSFLPPELLTVLQQCYRDNSKAAQELLC